MVSLLVPSLLICTQPNKVKFFPESARVRRQLAPFLMTE